MRLPFKFDESDLNQDSRIKFIFTSPELHQNIEISLDAEKTSVDSILDAFERFLSALGITIPEDVVLQFVRVGSKGEKDIEFFGNEDEEDEDEEDEDEDKDEEEDEDEDGDNYKKKRS